MVDARIPERYLNDRRILRLSFEAWWTYSFAMTWSVSNRTDGVIEEGDLALIPRANPACAGELEKAGLWENRGDHWIIRDFDSTQTSANELAVLENARKRDREKKARQRSRRKDDPDDVPGDVPGGQSPATAQARPGKARRGVVTATNGKSESRSKDLTDVGKKTSQLNEKQTDDWPVVAPVGAAFESSDRCLLCGDPIDPAAGSVHPSCETSDFEHDRTS